MAKQIRSKVLWFGTDNRFDFWTDGTKLMHKQTVLLPAKELPLVGKHNQLNALAAATVAFAYGIGLDPIRAALREARAVEHRIEFVAEKHGVTYVNDSKSTNMTATLTALDAFPKNVILLFGGRPKKESFAPLAKRFPVPVKAMIHFGEAREKVRTELPSNLPIEETDTMQQAVQRARAMAVEGDTVLLSPGCASYDQFNNFEERGQFYKTYVMNL
jgi:UDP-N-acetylmuramoylalanine--D-glutamate ligase